MLLLPVCKVNDVQYVKGCPCACHEGIWGNETHLHLLPISVLEGCEWVVSWMLCPGGRTLGTHLIGCLMGLRASVDALEKWEMCCFCHKLNCDFLVVQLMAYWMSCAVRGFVNCIAFNAHIMFVSFPIHNAVIVLWFAVLGVADLGV
jgi:hypothetical protein